MPSISKAKLAKLEEATATVSWISWFGTLPPDVLREGLIAGQTGHISFPQEGLKVISHFSLGAGKRNH